MNTLRTVHELYSFYTTHIYIASCSRPFLAGAELLNFRITFQRLKRVWFIGGVLWRVCFNFFQILYTYPHFWVVQESKHIGYRLLHWKGRNTLKVHSRTKQTNKNPSIHSCGLMTLFLLLTFSWNISINHIKMFRMSLHFIYSAMVNGTCSMWYS